MRFYTLRLDSLFFPKATPIFDSPCYDIFNNETKLSWWRFPSGQPTFPIMEIDGEASPTDFLTQVNFEGVGMIVSEKIQSLFGKFSFFPHKYYPLQVSYKGAMKDGDYFWMQLIDDGENLIDFERSEFFVEEFKREMYGVALSTPHHLETTFKSLEGSQGIAYRKLVLNDTYKRKNYDILYFHYLMHGDLVVSERLKDALENSCASGIECFIEKPISAVVGVSKNWA